MDMTSRGNCMRDVTGGSWCVVRILDRRVPRVCLRVCVRVWSRSVVDANGVRAGDDGTLQHRVVRQKCWPVRSVIGRSWRTTVGRMLGMSMTVTMSMNVSMRAVRMRGMGPMSFPSSVTTHGVCERAIAVHSNGPVVVVLSGMLVHRVARQRCMLRCVRLRVTVVVCSPSMEGCDVQLRWYWPGGVVRWRVRSLMDHTTPHGWLHTGGGDTLSSLRVQHIRGPAGGVRVVHRQVRRVHRVVQLRAGDLTAQHVIGQVLLAFLVGVRELGGEGHDVRKLVA